MHKVTDTYENITTYVRDSNAWILVEGRYESATGITTTTAYTYDLKGNVLTRTEAQSTAMEKTTTYTYHPVFNGILTETAQSVVNPTLFSTVTDSFHPATGNLLTREELGYMGDGTPYIYDNLHLRY